MDFLSDPDVEVQDPVDGRDHDHGDDYDQDHDQDHDHDQDPDPDQDQALRPDTGPALLELRVLSGLQAGAALPLDQPLLVGKSEDCDLLLLDDHAPAHLLELAVGADGGLHLTAMHDGLLLEDGTPISGTVELAPGQPFGLERLWLEVQPMDAPWAAWVDPSERGHGPRAALESDEWETEDGEAKASETSEDANASAVRSEWPLSANASAQLDDWMLGDDDDSPWQADPAQGPASLSSRAGATAARTAPSPLRRRQRWKTWSVVGAGALMTAGGLLALAGELGLLGAQDARAATAAAPDEAVGTVAAVGVAAAPTSPPARPSESTRAPSSSAGPSDPDPTQLPGRNDRVRSGGGVTVVQGGVDITLPFEVREVVLGARSRVVLTSGQVLLPGDAVGRWRLMEIKAGTLVFDGPQRVLLPW